MATVPFSAFYDHIMPELKGATTGMVDLHLLHTARDFCERTSAWLFAFAVSSAADEATYDISAPEQSSEIVRLTKLTIDDELLWDDQTNTATVGDAPKYRRDESPFSMNIGNTEFTLIEDEIPAAAGTDNIELVAALKPSFAATTLPDFLKFEQLEAMRTGTLARLMRMGSKPWTDRALSLEYAAEFQRYCLLARGRAHGGNTKQRLRTRTAIV